MKTTVYLRVARDPKKPRSPKVVSTLKPSYAPITAANGTPLPTVSFAVEFELPDHLFRDAERVVAKVLVEQAEAYADVTLVAPEGQTWRDAQDQAEEV